MSVASPQPEPSQHEAPEGIPARPAGSAATPTRASRQDLVVKASGPSAWMAVAVVGCGLMGFATAFYFEIGRSRGAGAHRGDLAHTPEVLAPESTAEPIGFLAPSLDGEAATVAGYSSETPPSEDRYATFHDDPGSTSSGFRGGAVTTAAETVDDSTLAPEEVAPGGAGGGVMTTRKPPVPFQPPASADLPPLTYAVEETVADDMIADEVQADVIGETGLTRDEMAGDEMGDVLENDEALSPSRASWGQNALTDVDGSAVGVDGVADEPTGALAREESPSEQGLLAPLPEGEPTPAGEDSWGETTTVGFAADAAAHLLDPQPQGDVADAEPVGGMSFRRMEDVQPGFATPVGQNSPSRGTSQAPLGFDDPDAPIAVTPPSMPPRGDDSAEADDEASLPPASSRYASSDAVRAFGGSLPERPMFPAADATGDSLLPDVDETAAAADFPAINATPGDQAIGPPAFPGAGPGYGVTGVGRPGAPLLEGVQTPQVAIEKRGPREIQVGKFARYEILVRNLGSVTAHDVELFDTVPQGTSLVSTTPPAAPGAQGELTWPLGSLGPGEQARVLVEVLPTEEGEVGSVASVRFAARASVRSLATRPALAMNIEQPTAMRIGGEVTLLITVSNPGTGRATGVVLEGVLPEGLAHRAGRELEFDIGSLKPGESRSIDLVLATTGAGLHRMDIGVRGDGQLEERQTVAVEVTAPTLELTAELPSRRYLQRPVTCVLSMANSGTAAARSVELATQLPPGLKFISANNAGYYDEKNHRVLWQLEELPPAEIGSVEVVLMPIALGSQQVVAAARSPDGLADQVTHVLEVEGVAALTFSVIDSEDPIEVDGLTEYVIRIGNQGTKAASDVQVTASMLGDLQPMDASGPVGHRVENLTVVFEPLARLAPTEEAVFRVQSRGRRAGDQRMQVQVTSDDHQTPVTKEEVTRVYADR
ncbi:MAG: hypothetical protein ACO3NZ_13195 [Pirellulales bacterium]